mmetsp:Transcript_5049/g.18170  ORF Transcript_5049/g.18170 Transcript_5049/m.18170 type:complete len:208 (-) Transcript_5049:579-1202(-)
MMPLAEQLCRLLSKSKNLVDDWRVVQTLFGGPGDVLLVHLLPQRAVLRMLLYRQVGRHVQREHPGPLLRRRILVSLALGCLSSESKRARRQPGNLLLLLQADREGLGAVKNVVAELGAQSRELLLQIVVALLLLPLEGNPGQLGVPDGGLHDSLLGRGERLELLALLDRLERVEQGLVLHQLQVHLHHCWLRLLHSLAKRVVVPHPL